jgi:hypothetical protein
LTITQEWLPENQGYVAGDEPQSPGIHCPEWACSRQIKNDARAFILHDDRVHHLQEESQEVIRLDKHALELAQQTV